MTEPKEDPRVQRLLEQITNPNLTEEQLKLLEQKLKVLRGKE